MQHLFCIPHDMVPGAWWCKAWSFCWASLQHGTGVLSNTCVTSPCMRGTQSIGSTHGKSSHASKLKSKALVAYELATSRHGLEGSESFYATFCCEIGCSASGARRSNLIEAGEGLGCLYCARVRFLYGSAPPAVPEHYRLGVEARTVAVLPPGLSGGGVQAKLCQSPTCFGLAEASEATPGSRFSRETVAVAWCGNSSAECNESKQYLRHRGNQAPGERS